MRGEGLPGGKGIPRWGFAAAAALCTGLAVGAASFLPAWGDLERKLFDQLAVATAPGKSSLPITIVGIDEASFSQIGLRWPWPRHLFAQAIDRLHAAGAAVIALDLVFYEESEPKEDEALAAAIARAGNVVLAADHAYHETPLVRQWIRVDPLPRFLAAGALSGLATVELDRDAVVRRLPQQHDSLWRSVVKALMQTHPGLIPHPVVGADDMVRYLGPAHTFPYVSFYQVLAGDPSIPPDFFNHQIVLIGRDVRANPEAGSTHADAFATPFVLVNRLLTPGVEIQATFIENAIGGQAIEPASRAAALAFLAAAILLTLPAAIRWHLGWSGAWVAAVALAAAGAVYALFAGRSYWMPLAAPLAALTGLYLAMAAHAYFSEQRRARQIRFAFSRYVSPHVVDEIVAHPESLRLGGERRTLTMLFSDLAGFTSISEKLSPEAVAHLVNEYLTVITRTVHRHGGTVSKFIGDGMFAFWGAPLGDPQHARHAFDAARDMQAALREMSAAFVAGGGMPLQMRVGMHTGEAIIGNMGSAERFDYTALGDSVNLAARLEGANKLYGTLTLFSGATAAALQGAVLSRRIDRIRVKGKAEPIDVFTPCEDPVLASLTEAALVRYRAQDWPAARAAWQAVLAHAGNDPVANVLLERIDFFERNPPGPDWDGSVALEKL